MALARTGGYVVFTHDLDFGALLASASDTKPSVVQVRGQDIFPNTIGTKVLTTLRSLTDYLDSGALITIDLRRSRVRLLPIRSAY